MTSQKTKTERLEQSRIVRAKVLAEIDTCDPDVVPPAGAILADKQQLAHNNTYGPLPGFYIDKVVVCRQCKTEEVWSADQQKWWYEVAKGDINTTAVLCRMCREKEKKCKDEARRIHIEGLKKKHGHNGT